MMDLHPHHTESVEGRRVRVPDTLPDGRPTRRCGPPPAGRPPQNADAAARKLSGGVGVSGSGEGPWGHSHSMVPGGLLVTSRTTRLTSATSLVMRVEMRASTSYGSRVQSAVIASSDETGRSTIGWP